MPHKNREDANRYHRNKWRTDPEYKKKRMESQRKSQKKRIAKMRERVKHFKKEKHGNKCVDCGFDKVPEILEFHHINSNEKEKKITSMLLYSWSRIEEELNKCVLLCPNCHAIRHLQLVE